MVERIKRYFKACGIEMNKDGAGVTIDPETGKNISKRAVAIPTHRFMRWAERPRLK